MKKVIRYQAKDGKEFSTEVSAILWEELINKSNDATEAFQNGATLLEAIEKTGWTRVSIYGEILGKITKDTELIISYWQCKEKPGYKVIRFNPEGNFWVHGDAGCWSGSYGANVNLVDLVRYARDTFKKLERTS